MTENRIYDNGRIKIEYGVFKEDGSPDESSSFFSEKATEIKRIKTQKTEKQ